MTERVKLLPEFKKAWLEALRSGEYRQTVNHLRNHDTFCCLGVACDLAIKMHPGLGTWEGGDVINTVQPEENKSMQSHVREMNRSTSYPTTRIIEAMFGPLPEHASPSTVFLVNTPENVQRTLDRLNDEGMPFVDIAKLIEEQL